MINKGTALTVVTEKRTIKRDLARSVGKVDTGLKDRVARSITVDADPGRSRVRAGASGPSLGARDDKGTGDRLDRVLDGSRQLGHPFTNIHGHDSLTAEVE